MLVAWLFAAAGLTLYGLAVNGLLGTPRSLSYEDARPLLAFVAIGVAEFATILLLARSRIASLPEVTANPDPDEDPAGPPKREEDAGSAPPP